MRGKAFRPPGQDGFLSRSRSAFSHAWCELFSAAASILKPMSEVTRILAAVERGDAHAANELLPLVYNELRKLAAVRLAAESAGHTLQPTALANEAFIKLFGRRKARNLDWRWNSIKTAPCVFR